MSTLGIIRTSSSDDLHQTDSYYMYETQRWETCSGTTGWIWFKSSGWSRTQPAVDKMDVMHWCLYHCLHALLYKLNQQII